MYFGGKKLLLTHVHRPLGCSIGLKKKKTHSRRGTTCWAIVGTQWSNRCLKVAKGTTRANSSCCFWRYSQTATSHTKRWPSRRVKERKDRLVSWIHACFWAEVKTLEGPFQKALVLVTYAWVRGGQRRPNRIEKQKGAHTFEALGLSLVTKVPINSYNMDCKERSTRGYLGYQWEAEGISRTPGSWGRHFIYYHQWPLEITCTALHCKAPKTSWIALSLSLKTRCPSRWPIAVKYLAPTKLWPRSQRGTQFSKFRLLEDIWEGEYLQRPRDERFSWIPAPDLEPI